MRYFLIKATKKRGHQAEFVAVQEMADVQTLMEEYQKAELAMHNDAPVLPYSLFLRDEDDVLNAMGRKFVEISNELNNDVRRKEEAPKQRLVSLDKDECALVYFLLGYAEQTEKVRRIREKLSVYKEF